MFDFGRHIASQDAWAGNIEHDEDDIKRPASGDNQCFNVTSPHIELKCLHVTEIVKLQLQCFSERKVG